MSARKSRPVPLAISPIAPPGLWNTLSRDFQEITMRPAKNEKPSTEVRYLLPREERIRRRAYELWLKHGREAGRALRDWLEAEREVTEWEETQKIG